MAVSLLPHDDHGQTHLPVRQLYFFACYGGAELMVTGQAVALALILEKNHVLGWKHV